jgi:hypothetical protein
MLLETRLSVFETLVLESARTKATFTRAEITTMLKPLASDADVTTALTSLLLRCFIQKTDNVGHAEFTLTADGRAAADPFAEPA